MTAIFQSTSTALAIRSHIEWESEEGERTSDVPLLVPPPAKPSDPEGGKAPTGRLRRSPEARPS